MTESRRETLSIGVFLVILVVGIMLYAVGIIDWLLIFPVILVLSGCWILVLATIRVVKPQKYERSAFGTLSLGLILMSVGGAWYLFAFNPLYSVALVLLVLGVLVISAALWRK